MSGELPRMVPGMALISSFAGSDRTAISGEKGMLGLSWSMSKIGFSYSHSHALAYKSSRFMITFGFGFHSRGVVFTSGMGCRGRNWCSLFRKSTWVLSVTILRTKKCCLVKLFLQCTYLSTENLCRIFSFLVDVIWAVRHTQTLFFSILRHWFSCHSTLRA